MCDIVVGSSASLRVAAVNILQLLVFLCVRPLQPLSLSLSLFVLSSSLSEEMKVAFDFNQGTARVIFCNPVAYCTPYVYFNNLVIQMHHTTKDLHPSFRTASVSPCCTLSEKTTIGPKEVGKKVSIQFSSTLHHTRPPCRTPNSPLCTSISGSVVELLDNSKHYQPQCHSTFVSCMALLWLFFGSRSSTWYVHFLLHACVCVY